MIELRIPKGSEANTDPLISLRFWFVCGPMSLGYFIGGRNTELRICVCTWYHPHWAISIIL